MNPGPAMLTSLARSSTFNAPLIRSATCLGLVFSPVRSDTTFASDIAAFAW